jgi:hypothetical protein
MVNSDDLREVELTCRVFERRNHSSGMQKRKVRRAEELSGLDTKGVSITLETTVERGSFEDSDNGLVDSFGSFF